MLKDTGDKLTAADRSAIESAIETLKTASAGTDPAAIRRALEQLTAAQHKAAETLYRQQAAGAAAGGAGAGAGGGGAQGGSAQGGAGAQKTGDVIDAEVVDEGKQ